MKNIVTLPGNLEIKKNYIMMARLKKFDYRSYYRENNSLNPLIDRLATLFKDHGTDVKWILEELTDPQSRGITGSASRIKIRGDKVILEPSSTMEENPEDYAIEIDRDILIRLATEWQDLVRREVPEIFIFYKDREYFVSDALPEGVD